MTVQPQIDVKFINQILNSHGKKTTNPFHLNRLDIAISQFEKYDVIEGISARADYLQYINEYEEALMLLNSAIKKYGLKEAFLVIKIKILTHLGDWNLLKPIWEEFFLYSDINLQKLYFDIYHTQTLVFLDDDFSNKLPLSFNQANSYKSTIKNLLIGLKEIDVSLNTYRTLVQTIYKSIYQHYNLEFLNSKLRLYDDILQIIITSEFWDTNDLKQLYQEVNEAILTNDDVDFHIEADNIEIIFINFPIEDLPQDFRLDNDDDNDLIDIVSKRMQNTKEEMVKIEVENA